MSKDSKEKKDNNKFDDVISTYLAFIHENNRHPNLPSLAKLGITRDAIRHNFGSLTDLREYMIVTFPEVFENIVDERFFDPERVADIQKEIKKHKRFVVTTAVTVCDTFKPAHKALQSYCEQKDAMLLILPSMDPAARGAGWAFDPHLKDDYLVGGSVHLNSNLEIRLIQLSAKQIDPTTGLDRLQAESAFIYASPKQRMRMLPAGTGKSFPHPIMGTGAITLPSYETDIYMSKRTAHLATHDHVMGALIIEVENDEIYHYRQIQFDKDGHFIDLGVEYSPEGKTKKVKALGVFGDWHAGETDPLAKKGCLEVAKEVELEHVVVHDMFNGKWNNHHDVKKRITRAKLATNEKIKLTDEIQQAINEVNDILKCTKGNIIWVKSNHDEVLERYLEDGRDVNDPLNYRFASQLVAPFIDGLDPLVFAIDNFEELQYNKVTGKPLSKVTLLKDRERVKFLKRDESFKYGGIECGQHGDLGPNGAKATPQNLEKAYSNCVVGHSHTPQIFRGVWIVGTTSLKKLNYTRGASSWMHTMCLVYPNGSKQLINFVEGSWRIKDKKKRSKNK